MDKSIIAEGKTTNEAIENGLKELKVSKEQVNIKVLNQEDKRSFFSILNPRVVKVELTLKEENNKKTTEIIKKEYKEIDKKELEYAENNVKVFLDELIEKLKIKATYQIKYDERGLDITLNGEESTFLIGYRGENLYAMQNILSSVASKKQEDRIRVLLDIEGYKQKRELTLKKFAEKMAEKAIRTKKQVVLEPMKAYERKIIHSALQDNENVETKSIGEEPKRKIVIYLK